ncbi:MAG: TatD family hydrolase [Opitutaceae bacterium]|nr:TatD family hydrolase [Opitutaceae bacterium]
MTGLIDTHTHLESFVRRGELDATLAHAAAAGVGTLVTIGTAADDWGLYRDLAQAHPRRIRYSAGLHPCSVDAGWEQEVAQLAGFWGRARTLDAPSGGIRSAGPAVPPYPVALGECGLDRFHLPKDAAAAEQLFAWQRAAFAAQLELARSLACPVVVHSRGAFAECVDMVDASGMDWAKVVFHCFTEGPAEISELMRRGGWGSFTGIITYKSAANVREAARVQGLERLMLETDAPYLTPAPQRGKPNEPAYLRHTADFCAELFGVDHARLAEITTRNARAFYRI